MGCVRLTCVVSLAPSIDRDIEPCILYDLYESSQACWSLKSTTLYIELFSLHILLLHHHSYMPQSLSEEPSFINRTIFRSHTRSTLVCKLSLKPNIPLASPNQFTYYCKLQADLLNLPPWHDPRGSKNISQRRICPETVPRSLQNPPARQLAVLSITFSETSIISSLVLPGPTLVSGKDSKTYHHG